MVSQSGDSALTFSIAKILTFGKKKKKKKKKKILFPLSERGAQGANPLAGGDHSSDHPVCTTGHPGGVFPHHDSTEETSVRGHV